MLVLSATTNMQKMKIIYIGTIGSESTSLERYPVMDNNAVLQFHRARDKCRYLNGRRFHDTLASANDPHLVELNTIYHQLIAHILHGNGNEYKQQSSNSSSTTATVSTTGPMNDVVAVTELAGFYLGRSPGSRSFFCCKSKPLPPLPFAAHVIMVRHMARVE
jgi:hypothetical protein